MSEKLCGHRQWPEETALREALWRQTVARGNSPERSSMETDSGQRKQICQRSSVETDRIPLVLNTQSIAKDHLRALLL